MCLVVYTHILLLIISVDCINIWDKLEDVGGKCAVLISFTGDGHILKYEERMFQFVPDNHSSYRYYV